jgi:hypothetical protein
MGKGIRKGGGWRVAWDGKGGAWAGGALAAAALVLTVLALTGGSSVHPAPRAHVHAGDVVTAERYAAYPRVAAAYEKAAAIPEILDGLYCHCDCSDHSGHYSLLDCFRDDHAAYCDVCMAEAELAYAMTGDGKSLAEIRAAIDGFYGH